MKVITLLNEKGGVGKTTLAVHLASGLAIRGSRVLLIDADAQANATANLGIGDRPLLHDLLVRDLDWQDAMVRLSPEIYEVRGESPLGELFLVPGSIETRVISTLVDDPYFFLDKIEQIENIDYVIIDTSPSPSLFHGSIYMATDGVIYPTHLEYLAFMGLHRSISRRQDANKRRASIGQKEMNIIGIIPTMYRKRTMEHTDNLAELHAQYPGKVWSPIHLRTIWTEASRLHRPVWGLVPHSEAAGEAWKMVAQFESEIVNV